MKIPVPDSDHFLLKFLRHFWDVKEAARSGSFSKGSRGLPTSAFSVISTWTTAGIAALATRVILEIKSGVCPTYAWAECMEPRAKIKQTSKQIWSFEKNLDLIMFKSPFLKGVNQ